jgi:hypothetical protein
MFDRKEERIDGDPPARRKQKEEWVRKGKRGEGRKRVLEGEISEEDRGVGRGVQTWGV